MAEDELDLEMDRQMRLFVGVGAQLVERVARIKADIERAEEQAYSTRSREAVSVTERARRKVEQQIQQERMAGRSVYGHVHNPSWWRAANEEQMKVRFGEAYATAVAMREVDPVARTAARHLHVEANTRYEENAENWMAQAVEAWERQQAHVEQADQLRAEAAQQERDDEATRDQGTEEERPGTETAPGSDLPAREGDTQPMADRDAGDAAENTPTETLDVGPDNDDQERIDSLRAAADKQQRYGDAELKTAEEALAKWEAERHAEGRPDIVQEAHQAQDVRHDGFPTDAATDLQRGKKRRHRKARTHSRGQGPEIDRER